MPSSTENVKLGVCKVTWGTTDLGYTKGGVEVEVTTETYEVMVDQFGNSPIKEYITARTCTVRAPLAETTLENLVKIMPGATLIGTTTKKVVVPNATSTDLLPLAQKLVLHPIALADSNKSEDFVIPKASTAGAMTFSYKLDEERIFNVEFKAYPDTAANGTLFIVGDETATA
jgi:hypothetical protein